VFNDTLVKQISFVCPKCKQPFRSDDSLLCSECNRSFPIIDGVPDFIKGDLQANAAPVYGGTSGLITLKRMARQMDFFAPVYESVIFASTLVKLSGIHGDSRRFIDRIANFHSKTLDGINGSLLDVACGPATYGRRLACASRNIYGIDISMGMLQQGLTYIKRDHVQGVHLARARVEELPFEDAVFDGVICSGSLHLFPDPVLALREIKRTMKPGAPISIQTFVAGKTLINRFVQGHSWVHTFELVELQRDINAAGFEEFQPTLDGIVLTFSARKAAART